MISASIVVYKTTYQKIEKLVQSCIESKLITKIYIIDNSPYDQSIGFSVSDKVNYIFVGGNIGFGKAHNIAIKQSINEGYIYHIVINPDILFDSSIVEQIYEYCENDLKVGLVMPKILYPDGNIQYLPKLLPSPFRMVLRKIPLPNQLFIFFNKNYEMRMLKDIRAYEVPIISGCFSFFRVEVLKEIGFYDERFFMYFEDFDLSRRINKHYKTIYYPEVFVYHEYERGASKNIRLLRIFISSAIKYFGKWGWFLDLERGRVNRMTIKKIKYHY